MTRKFGFLAFLLAVGAAGTSSAIGQDRCYTSGEGRAMIESQRIKPFPEVAHQAGIPFEQVQGVELCDSDRGYSYDVDVVREGRRERTKIPAGDEPPSGEIPE